MDPYSMENSASRLSSVSSPNSSSVSALLDEKKYSAMSLFNNNIVAAASYENPVSGAGAASMTSSASFSPGKKYPPPLTASNGSQAQSESIFECSN